MQPTYKNQRFQFQLWMYFEVSWMYLEQFVRNKSMHDGLFGFLKQVGSLLTLLRLLTLEKALKQPSFKSELRSPK